MHDTLLDISQVRNSNPQLKCSYRYGFIVHPEILAQLHIVAPRCLGFQTGDFKLVVAESFPYYAEKFPYYAEKLCFMLSSPY